MKRVKIRVINLAWQLGGDARLLRQAADGVDALILVECRDKANRPIQVARILGPGWWVWQDTSSGSTAGTAIAVRKGGLLSPRRRPSAASVLRLISPKGHKVQARFMRTARLRDADGPITLAGAHPPLRSTGLQDEALVSLRKWWRQPRKGRKLASGDGNNAPKAIAHAIGAGWVAGADVMFACWSAGPWDDDVRVTHKRMAGTDHNVLTITYPLRSTAA